MQKQTAEARTILAQLTLEEKAALCSGMDFWHTEAIERVGLPGVRVSDGPSGLRVPQPVENEGTQMGLQESFPAVCYPTSATLACSWDPELLTQVGHSVGREAQKAGVNVLLGPGMNIKRSPLCGRNFEYFSEDPYLAGKLAAGIVRGVQSEGVGGCLKHFAANNQEHNRLFLSAEIDERTLREIYLAGFELAVKESHPVSMMCAYNKLNGTYCSENHQLLTEILREEWGFDGLVMSDWGAVNDRVKGVQAGLDLEMPGGSQGNTRKILAAVENGQLSVEELERAALRVIDLVLTTEATRRPVGEAPVEEAHQIAGQAAEESAVLLKNDNDLLPLDPGAHVAIIGAFARDPRYQGGGSSHVNAIRVEQPVEELRRNFTGILTFAPGYHLEHDQVDPFLEDQAVRQAAAGDVAVIFAGLPERMESEGCDRDTLAIPGNQVQLIRKICRVQPNTVVVLSNGSPIEMPWVDKVKAVLELHLGGEAGAGAAARILCGRVNPSGKLAETYPLRLCDTPCYLNFPGERERVKYDEGVFVGYRWYEKRQLPVLFPFGHGLSYTTFQYSDLTLSADQIKESETLTVTCFITNTGHRAGREVVQLYVTNAPAAVNRPEKELRGFAKVRLEPGETKPVTFTLHSRSWAYYSESERRWVTESGTYGVEIAASSADLRLHGEVTVHSEQPPRIHYSRNMTLREALTDPKASVFFRPLLEQALDPTDFKDAEGEENIISTLLLRSLDQMMDLDLGDQIEAICNRLNQDC